ncbi:hypothetical protein T484DRAFT_3647899 [Baffinella frigidus]|nr:hypothetical protein T484DRAFT_3647899 [Cryptophyta sp. CCMP2293]
MPPAWCAALLAATVIAGCAASTPCKQVHLGISGRLEMSTPPEGGECSALVLPRWHYPPAPSTALPDSPLVEVVEILDSSGRVVCGGGLIGKEWVITAGACLDSSAEVQWGPQRILVVERVADPRGGTEAVALLRLEHAICFNHTLRMDDGSNIGAGQLALPSSYQWQTRWASEDNLYRASADTPTSKHVLRLSMLRSLAGWCKALLVDIVYTSSSEDKGSRASRWNESMRSLPKPRPPATYEPALYRVHTDC